MYIYLYIYICKYIYTDIYAQTHAHTHTHIYIIYIEREGEGEREKWRKLVMSSVCLARKELIEKLNNLRKIFALGEYIFFFVLALVVTSRFSSLRSFIQKNSIN